MCPTNHLTITLISNHWAFHIFQFKLATRNSSYVPKSNNSNTFNFSKDTSHYQNKLLQSSPTNSTHRFQIINHICTNFPIPPPYTYHTKFKTIVNSKLKSTPNNNHAQNNLQICNTSLIKINDSSFHFQNYFGLFERTNFLSLQYLNKLLKTSNFTH